MKASVFLLHAMACDVAGVQASPLRATKVSGVERATFDGKADRIEELVRGRTSRVTVKNKRVGTRFILGDGLRDLSAGAGATRGPVGQRVWHVLSF